MSDYLMLDYQTRQLLDTIEQVRLAQRDASYFGEQPTTMADVARQIAQEERDARHAERVAQYRRTQRF